MGISVTGEKVKVIRKDATSQSGKAYTTYSVMVSSKDKDGNWANGFIDCRFKFGVEVANKTVINIKNAFFTVNAFNGKTYTKLMITEFEVVTEGEQKPVNLDVDAEGFMAIPDSIDDELPFA